MEAGSSVVTLFFPPKNRVKIMTVNFNEVGKDDPQDHHTGARDFVFWNLPQVSRRLHQGCSSRALLRMGKEENNKLNHIENKSLKGILR